MENKFPIEIIRSDRKCSVLIEIRWQMVRVRAPKNYPSKEIESLLRKRESWILEKLSRQAQIDRPAPDRKLGEGSHIIYLGRKYYLRLSPQKMRSAILQIIDASTMEIRYPKSWSKEKCDPNLRKVLQKWYYEQGLSYCNMRTKLFAKKIDVQPKRVRVRSYRARWGSCSVDHEISYNWRILLAPPKVVDYIVVHELCHLLEHNHSKRFWNHVANFFPSYATERQWLRDYGATLLI